jgi:hypothetical protein
LERVSRRPTYPPWAVMLVLVWLALLGAAELVGKSRGTPVILCPFRALTSIPCPTCGTTSMVWALLAGRPVDAFFCNPLMAVLGLVAAGVLLLKILFARRLVIQRSADKTEKNCSPGRLSGGAAGKQPSGRLFPDRFRPNLTGGENELGRRQ